MIRVAIADDHQLVRTGLGALLGAEADIEVIALFANGRQAVDYVTEHEVDVLLMDLEMPVLDGVEATREVREARPETTVLVLTTFPDDAHISQALRAGATGYLLKTGSTEELVDAVREAHRGRRAFAPDVLDRLVENFAAGPRPTGVRPAVFGGRVPRGGGRDGALGGRPTRVLASGAPGWSGVSGTQPAAAAESSVPPELASLTDRELDVFVEVGRGQSNHDVASTLHLSEATIKTYVTRILAKLGLRSRVQIVVLAFETGIVTRDAR